MSEALIEPVVIDYDSLGEELTRILPQELDGGWQIAKIIEMILVVYSIPTPADASLICVQAASDYSDYLVEQLCNREEEEIH
jgi:hypothetical protein|tara:strand:- start:2152 stop:2397 length:246 start_codon:yes stop_codon:yes gene_type:complete